MSRKVSFHSNGNIKTISINGRVRFFDAGGEEARILLIKKTDTKEKGEDKVHDLLELFIQYDSGAEGITFMRADSL